MTLTQHSPSRSYLKSSVT